jgi:hypothetical protein
MPIFVRSGFRVVNGVFESCDFDWQDGLVFGACSIRTGIPARRLERDDPALATLLAKPFFLAHLNIGPEFKIIYNLLVLDRGARRTSRFVSRQPLTFLSPCDYSSQAED